MYRVLLAIFVSGSTNMTGLMAEDWPQWRGAHRDAVSRESGLLETWPTGGPKLAWRASGLGIGYASVVVGEGRLFTLGGNVGGLTIPVVNPTDEESDKRLPVPVSVIAIDEATGKLLWTRTLGETTRNINSTPTLDGDRLYALDPDGRLVCLNAATGDLIWQRRFVEDFNSKMMSARGCGESPLVDEDRLICTPGNRDAAMVSLNKFTGEVIWKAKLPELGPLGRDGAGFSSIVVSEAAGIRQYVQLLGRGVIGIEAATGRYLWGYNAIANEHANIPTPIVNGEYVFAANGYTAGSVLLKLVRDPMSVPQEPKVDAQVVYSLSGSQFQNHHGGIIRLGDHVFAGHGNNNGLPTCLELETGRILWKRRGPGVGSAAIVCADGQLIFRYQNGLVALIEASPARFALHGTFEIPGAGGDSWSHPVVANGHLFLREQDSLWVYDLRRIPEAEATAQPTGTEMAQLAVVERLRKLGVVVESIATDADRGKLRNVFRFAVPTESMPLKLVTIADEVVSEEGTIADAVVSQLASFTEPMIVNLEGTRISDAGFTPLRALPIVALNLELCSRLTDVSCSSLTQLRQLVALVLSGTKVTSAGLAQLAKNSQIIALELELCDAINDDDCQTLGSMKSLRWLNLKKSGFEKRGISDIGLEQLKALTELETLNLYGNKITNAGLIHLQSLKRLRDLDLSLLNLNDAGIEALSPLVSLERLNLMFTEGFAGPSLTDRSSRSLAPLRRLSWLNLNGSKLTDFGLEQLQDLKQLKSLLLVRTKVTEAGQRKFQQALPECEVVR